MTFLPRKIYEPGGLAYLYTDGQCKPLAPHLAGLMRERGQVREVTWAEILEQRRERQAERLQRKREWFVSSWRPVFIDVRYYDIQVYTGWHTYIYGIGGISFWFRGPHRDETVFMNMIPLRDGLFPVQSHEHWMEVFARTYQCGTQDKRPRGRLQIWARVSGTGHNATIHEYSLTKP